MSWLGDVFAFESFNLQDMLKRAAKNPDQLLLGAADPFSAKMWGKITGKKYEPLVNQWGGASDGAYQRAEAAGINTGAGRQAHQIAQTIASIYAGGAAAGAMGGGAAAGGGAGGGGFLGGSGAATATNSVGPLASGYAYAAPTAVNSVGPLAAGYGYGTSAVGAYGAQFPGAVAVSANGVPLNSAPLAQSSGFSFDDLNRIMQNMPQGGGQQDEGPQGAPSLGSAPRSTGQLPVIARGEIDYTSKRRRKRRGLLDPEN